MRYLYPPYIDAVIPALTNSTLIIPFLINRGVSSDQIKRAYLRIKDIQTNSYIVKDISSSNFTTEDGIKNKITFNVSEQLNIGQNYKVQIAFEDTSGSGQEDLNNLVYSSVGICKKTYNSESSINQSGVGTYTNQDPTERCYKYRFTATIGDKIYSTDWKVHDSTNDTQGTGGGVSSTDQFPFILLNESCNLRYETESINGVTSSSTLTNYNGGTPTSISNNAIIVTNNYDQGYCLITVANGYNNSYVIKREEGQDKAWQIVGKIKNNIVKDYNIKNGITYQYSLMTDTNGSVTYYTTNNNVYTVQFTPYFEHTFLFDKDKQLCIKFNPNISVYKTNTQESKNETIGNKYPFIFRNNEVGYKEFTISGLISYLSDAEGLFWQELIEQDQPKRGDDISNYDEDLFTTKLSDKNIRREMVFKNQVLDWLNDGKPKVLKTPTEGNFIVYIQNISMAPNTALGRMLHTFQCSALEIADYNGDGLVKFGLVDSPTGFTSFVPSGTEIDKGSIQITSNGNHNVSNYSNAIVNVSPQASGKINITNTNQIDVTSYATAQINDANLKADNIKRGETILGVTGTYDNSTQISGTYSVTDENIQNRQPVNVEQFANVNFNGVSFKTNTDLTQVGKQVSVAPGYYSREVSKSVNDGSIILEDLTFDEDNGTITSAARLAEAGWISQAPASKTYEIDVYTGQTEYGPSNQEQTISLAQKYVKNNIKIKPIELDENNTFTTKGTKTAADGKYFKQVNIDIPTDDYVDVSETTATAADILIGKKAVVTGSRVVTDGQMINNGAVQGSISTKEDSYLIPSGYHNGSGTVSISSNAKEKIISSNIKFGETVLGVAGSYTQTGTGEQAAAASDIASGKVAYVNGQKITGTHIDPGGGGGADYKIEDSKTAILNFSSPSRYQEITPSATYDGMAKVSIEKPNTLVEDNIKQGVSIAGITGTYNGSDLLESKIINYTQLDFREGAQTFDTFSPGKIGYSEVIFQVPSGLDPALIKYNQTVAGVTGTYTYQEDGEVDGSKTYRAATAADITQDAVAYVNGVKLIGTYNGAINNQTVSPNPIIPTTSEQSFNVDPSYTGWANFKVAAMQSMTLPTVLASTGSGSQKANFTVSGTQYLNIPPGYNANAQYYKLTAGGSTPSGNVDITSLNQYDVSGKATARISQSERNKIIGSNIKSGITILGVAGTYTGSGGGGGNIESYKTLTLGSAAPSTVSPSAGYDGIGEVRVALDSNVIKPANIAQGVTILGVRGTHSGGGGGGAQVASTSKALSSASSSIQFTSLLGEPTSFAIISESNLATGASPYKTADVVYDGANIFGQYITNTSNAQMTYSASAFSKSYSNNTLTVTGTGTNFQANSYRLIYTYGGSTSDVKTKTATVGSGATSISFTDLEEEPVAFYCILKGGNISTASGYSRAQIVSGIDNSIIGLHMGSQSQYSDTSWSTSYNNGTFTISSQSSSNGGYFHQGSGFSYQLIYITSSGSGGGDITIVPLTATENKTYTAPSGQAYSPVTVNVSGGGGSNELPPTSEWSGTTFTMDKSYIITSDYTIPANYTLTVSNGTNLLINGHFTNNGTINQDYGNIYLSRTGFVINNGIHINRGTIYFSNDNATYFNEGTLNNQGLIWLIRISQFTNNDSFTGNPLQVISDYAMISGTTNYDVWSINKNIQYSAVVGIVANSTSYTTTNSSITVAKTGTYKCSWMHYASASNASSYCTQLYINNSSIGSSHGAPMYNSTSNWIATENNIQLTQGDTVTVRARTASGSLNYTVAGMLVIEEN